MRDVSSAAHKKVLNDHDFILRGVAEHYENGLNDLSLVANVVLTYGDKEIVLDGSDYASTLSTLTVSVSLPGQWEVSPPGKSIWEDSVPASSLLALLASGWSADVLREEINRTLDNEGLLVNGKADEVTAKAIFDHHRKK